MKSVGLIVVTSDKGLCGGLNTNALRVALGKIKAWQASGVNVHVTAIGNKGLAFMHRLKANVVSQVVALGDRPHLDKIIGPVKVQLDMYLDGKIDELHIVATRFEIDDEADASGRADAAHRGLRRRKERARLSVGLHLRAGCEDACSRGC